MAHNTRVLGHIVAFLTVAVWGSTFVFTKLLLLSGLTAAQIFTLRFVIAYVSLMVFSLSRKSHRWMADTWRDELLMVGNSLKSDVVPALAIGCQAVYIPFHVTWQLEHHEHFEHPRMKEITHFGQLTEML